MFTRSSSMSLLVSLFWFRIHFSFQNIRGSYLTVRHVVSVNSDWGEPLCGLRPSADLVTKCCNQKETILCSSQHCLLIFILPQTLNKTGVDSDLLIGVATTERVGTLFSLLQMEGCLTSKWMIAKYWKTYWLREQGEHDIHNYAACGHCVSHTQPHCCGSQFTDWTNSFPRITVLFTTRG